MHIQSDRVLEIISDLVTIWLTTHQWRIQESLVGGDINPVGGLGGAVSYLLGSRGEAPGHQTLAT